MGVITGKRGRDPILFCPNPAELTELVNSGQHTIGALMERYKVGRKTFVRWLCRDCHKAWHRKHGEASNADTPPKWSGVRAAHIAAKKARLPLVIAMHKAGKAQKEIAAHFGIHPTAVHADLRDVGLTRQYTRG